MTVTSLSQRTAQPGRRQGSTATCEVTVIPVDRIRPDPENRPDGSAMKDLEGLAETIKVIGILNPITVVPYPGRNGYYMLRAGERRWRAARIAGLTTVPGFVRTDLAGSARAAVTRVIENTARVSHEPVELALSLGRLIDEGMTQADIARLTGLAQPTVSYHLELLRADETTLNKVRRGELPVGTVHEAIKAAAAAPPGAGPVRSRQSSRSGAGRSQAGKRRAPAHFTAVHPLAADAHSLCTAAGHPAADRYGKVACGPCWEAAIRADARNAGGTPSAQAGRAAARQASPREPREGAG